MKKNEITVPFLFLKYEGFLFRDMGKELVGYNKEKNEYIIIDDGMCISVQGKWLVHHYKITDPKFKPFENKFCHEDTGTKISEKWVKLY